MLPCMSILRKWLDINQRYLCTVYNVTVSVSLPFMNIILCNWLGAQLPEQPRLQGTVMEPILKFWEGVSSKDDDGVTAQPTILSSTAFRPWAMSLDNQKGCPGYQATMPLCCKPNALHAISKMCRLDFTGYAYTGHVSTDSSFRIRFG